MATSVFRPRVFDAAAIFAKTFGVIAVPARAMPVVLRKSLRFIVQAPWNAAVSAAGPAASSPPWRRDAVPLLSLKLRCPELTGELFGVARLHAHARQLVGREGRDEVEPRDQRAVAGPDVRLIRVAGRRLRKVERLADLAQLARDRQRIVDRRAGRADRGDRVLERRLHFRAVVLLVPELVAGDHRLHRLAQIAVRGEEALRDAVDQGGRRSVGDEAPAELRRDELRGRRMTRE